MLSSGTAQSLPPGSCAFPTPLDRTPYVDLASRKQHIHDTRLPPIAMAESLRGNGLYDVHDALARLANNTALLDRALRRFGGDGDNEPPPPYYPPSTQSGTPTEPDIPNAGPADGPEAEAARQLEREFQLGLLHELSRPHEQFVAQSGALALRLAILRHSEKHPLLPFPEPDTETRLFLVRSELDEAGRIIRARWKEQRIWSGQWAQLPSHDSRWPHENAYEPAPPDSRRGKRRTRATEAAAAAVASRPYQQFMYQVAKERDLLLGHVADLDPPPLPNRKPFLLRTRRGNEPLLSPESERAADEEYERRRLQSLQTRIPRPLRKAPADIHTLAYKAVRADWERWKIWDPRWGVLPGMHWMHEEPQEIFIRRRIAEENGEEWIEADEEEDDEADEHEEQEQPVPNDQRPQEDTGQSELCGMQTMEEVRQQPAGNSDLFGLGSGLFTDNRGRVQVFGSLTSPPPAVPASGSIALDPFGAPLEEADRRPLSPPLVPPRQPNALTTTRAIVSSTSTKKQLQGSDGRCLAATTKN
ncbi:hypothetical protein SEUCBS139899_002205 [Sporothrix eucalyptigena]